MSGRLHAATIFQLTMPGAPGIYYGDEVGITGGDDPGSRGTFPWEKERTWDRRQLEITAELGSLRRRHPALRRGDWTPLWWEGDGLAYLRTHDGDGFWSCSPGGTHPRRSASTCPTPAPRCCGEPVTWLADPGGIVDRMGSRATGAWSSPSDHRSRARSRNRRTPRTTDCVRNEAMLSNPWVAPATSR